MARLKRKIGVRDGLPIIFTMKKVKRKGKNKKPKINYSTIWSHRP